jgi:hypothetical protein
MAKWASIRFFATLLLYFPLSGNAEKAKKAWPGPDKPVYVVTENHYAEGFIPGGNTPKFGDLIAIEIYNPHEQPAGTGDYRIGNHINLFVGGQKQGQVEIQKVMPLQCDSSAAVVQARPGVHLGKSTMALASNAERIRPHQNNQRQPTDAEIQRAKVLASNEFRKDGTDPGNLGGIDFDLAVVTRVDATDEQILAASFFIKTKGAVHQLFLIGKFTDAGVEAQLARYHKITEVEDGTDSQDVNFVDQLDLDGDGTDEIVVEVTGYESEAFTIYKRTGGHWTKVHVGGEGGC